MDERDEKRTVSAVALAGRSGSAAVAPAVSRQTRDQVDVVVAAHPGWI
jgi:ABC-type transporter Mla maintaining outer membrane lipid asymmetry permease subunit MlaE